MFFQAVYFGRILRNDADSMDIVRNFNSNMDPTVHVMLFGGICRQTMTDWNAQCVMDWKPRDELETVTERDSSSDSGLMWCGSD